MGTRTPGEAALKAGLFAGLLDISAAFIQYFLRTGKNPLTVLKFIASGVFGRRALTGGPDMMLWGLVFHFAIALSFAALYFWLAARRPVLRRAWIVSGIVYGLFAWAVMNLVVVPLSRTPELPFSWPGALIAMAILIGCIGLPIAYWAKRSGPYTVLRPSAGAAHN